MMRCSTNRIVVLCVVLGALAALSVTGCRSTYYAAMESFGKHKRDILVSRVADAREDQEAAKEQFRTALQRFSDVVRMPDSELKKKYETLNAEFEECEAKAASVSKRIDSIETVSEDLFDEWEQELDEYKSDAMRDSSERQLKKTRERYGELIAAMRKAEGTMPPVLDSFRDHVLFLKHNLNAQAVASLRGELTTLEGDTAALIREMEHAIAEADAFITEMKAVE